VHNLSGAAAQIITGAVSISWRNRASLAFASILAISLA
jgi:hypothetical protein